MHRETGWCGKLFVCHFSVEQAISGGGKEVSECAGDGSGHSSRLWRRYRSRDLVGPTIGPKACRL